jgi:hypothetical protein
MPWGSRSDSFRHARDVEHRPADDVAGGECIEDLDLAEDESW